MAVIETPRARLLAAVGLVAGCGLALQVVLSRLLGAALFYHFTFLVISLALLGTGAAGILLYLYPRWFRLDEGVDAAFARWSRYFGFSLAASSILLVRLDYQYVEFTGQFAVTLILTCLIAGAPSLVGGIALAIIIKGYAQQVGRVYAADLVGAGLGAGLIVPLMWRFDPPTLIMVLGVVAIAADWLASPTGLQPKAGRAATTVVMLALLAAAPVSNLFFLPTSVADSGTGVIVSDDWNPLSRVTAVRGDNISGVFYDRIYAPVFHAPLSEPIPGWSDMNVGPQSIGYELAPGTSALIIGGGGGRDIYNALSSGQTDVDVIELNDGIREAVDVHLADVSGAPYSRPGVQTTIGDGRSVLAARDTLYDTVHISFTDTLSANSAAAFALTENNLYTVEAFDEYFDRLVPGGILNVTRRQQLVGEEAIRLTVLTMEVLSQRGVENPEDNVVVILGRDIFGEIFGTVLARDEAWTSSELDQIRSLAAERGWTEREPSGIAFAPDGPYFEEWGELAAEPDHITFCENYTSDVCPPTDDQPFFFNTRRVDDIGRADARFSYQEDPVMILLFTLLLLLVLAGAGIVAPILLQRGRSRPSAGVLGYFWFIGLGFIMFEIVAVQRLVLFIGFPTYALSVVLFALLVFSGVGAFLTQRSKNEARLLTRSLIANVVLIAASSWLLPDVLRGLIDRSFGARVVISILLLMPVGLSLGMAMPLALRELDRLDSDAVPFAWGVNGLASIVGSVLAVFVALNFGFRVAGSLAAACYLGAVLLRQKLRSPDEAVSNPELVDHA